jgi:hypothetical protein
MPVQKRVALIIVDGHQEVLLGLRRNNVCRISRTIGVLGGIIK